MPGTRRKPGVMASHIEGLRAWLLERGYTPGTVRNELKVMGRLGRWMAPVGLDDRGLTESMFGRFVEVDRNRATRRVPSRRSFKPLRDYLGGQGALVSQAAVLVGPLEQLVNSYRDWLVSDRGLAEPTVVRYEKLARRFLDEFLSDDDTSSLSDLGGADVATFLLRETRRVSVGSAKGRVTELRSLLRFLFLKGLTPTALWSGVPPVAGSHDTGVPRGVTAGEVQRIVDACDRGDPSGIRDYAMLVLVARLGLRSIEVARLQLGDIDWRASEIVVRGKARRQDRLPLPCDVGEALAAYLSTVRPATQRLRGRTALRRGPHSCSVGVDDVEGGMLAVTHLLEEGHELIAFVGGPAGVVHVADRLEGAHRAMRSSGRPRDDLVVIETTALNAAEGRRAGEVLAGLPRGRRPTAAF